MSHLYRVAADFPDGGVTGRAAGRAHKGPYASPVHLPVPGLPPGLLGSLAVEPLVAVLAGLASSWLGRINLDDNSSCLYLSITREPANGLVSR